MDKNTQRLIKLIARAYSDGDVVGYQDMCYTAVLCHGEAWFDAYVSPVLGPLTWGETE